MAGNEAVYLFHSFRVDPARRLLLRDGQPASVTAKVFDLLLVLIRGRERVITRDELIGELWPDTTVEDGNLSVGISALRKALGATPSAPPIIETVPRVGYRFVADVREESAQQRSTPSEAPAFPRTEPIALALQLPAKLDAYLGPRPTAFHSVAADLAKTYVRLCSGERAEDGVRDVLVRGRQRGYGIFISSRVISKLVSSAFEYGVEVENARDLQQACELEPCPDAVGIRASKPSAGLEHR